MPIHKSGNYLRIRPNYRPISILSLLNKVFEKIINKRILEFSNQNSTINSQQCGFR